MNFARNIRFFNMIEVVLALVVLSVGVVTIMGLLPVALKASRDSVADNVVPLVADNVRAYVDSLKNNNSWTNFTGTVLSATEPTSENVKFDTITASETAANNVFASANMPEFALYRAANNIFIAKVRSGDATDFAAVVKIWREAMPDLFAANGSNNPVLENTVPVNYGVRVHVEIRWPLETSNTLRDSRRYVFEYIPGI